MQAWQIFGDEVTALGQQTADAQENETTWLFWSNQPLERVSSQDQKEKP